MPIAREIPEDLIADDAFWSQTELTPSGCIEWKGSRDAYGYGRVFARGAEWKAHRVALKLSGKIVFRHLAVDHLCRNPACVNPAHLELVSYRENTARGEGPTAAAIRAIDRGFCINGHDLSVVGFHGRGVRRFCAQCGRNRVAAYKLRRS